MSKFSATAKLKKPSRLNVALLNSEGSILSVSFVGLVASSQNVRPKSPETVPLVNVAACAPEPIATAARALKKSAFIGLLMAVSC